MTTQNILPHTTFFKYFSIALLIVAIVCMQSSCKGLYENFDASGTFEAVEVIVSAESTGKILTFDIEEGQILVQNQIIGKIDSTQVYLKKQQLASSKKSLQARRPNIKKQIAALEQQIITTKTERKRVENLLKADAANQKQLDDITAQITILEKQLDAQQSTLETSNQSINEDSEGIALQIAQLEDQLRKCNIISPINGTVLAKYAQMGEVATIGKALLKIANTQAMILRAYITQNQLTKLKIGQQVQVVTDFGTDNKKYVGVVTWISDKAEFTPKTIQTPDERANLVYAVKISVKNDGFLKIGMYGQIAF